MTKQNYLPPKGFRDIKPEEAVLRQTVIKTASDLALSFGFMPIETPTIEYKSVLMGKYGQEADKLIFSFTDRGDRQVALRYDQTVPLSRYVNRFRPKLPFKRYQIQPSFRAEKPQKGRYRELVQIDFDIVGDEGLVSDAEILLLTARLFDNLNISVTLCYNSRQDLYALFKQIGLSQDIYSRIAQVIDKLDKQSENKVRQELTEDLGLSSKQVSDLWQALSQAKPNTRLKQTVNLVKSLTRADFRYTPFLVRGLDYYTGLIFEVKVKDQSSSLAGGGRYDRLIKQAGDYLPAVGVGIGLDRIVGWLSERDKFDMSIVDVVILPLSDSVFSYVFKVADRLRQTGQKVLLYPSANKVLSKGWKYAQKVKAKQVAFIGEDEAKGGYITLKDVVSQNQTRIRLGDSVREFKAS